MLEPWRKRVRSDLGLDKRAKRPFDPPRVRVPSTPRFSDGAPRAETPATLAGANVLQTLSQDVGTLSTESPELSLRMRPVDFEGDFAPFLEVRQLKRVCGVMEEEIGDVQEDFVRLRTDALALYRFLLKKGFKEQASVVSTFHTAFQDIEQRHASLKRRVESFGPPDSEISDEEGRALFAECVTPGCITA